MNFETQPQETYATLRVYHAQLEPDQLTELFEIKPTMAWKMEIKLPLPTLTSTATHQAQ